MNQHSYYVRGKDASYTRGLPLMVTFTSTNPAFALPDTRVLASNGSSGDTLSYALTHGSKIEVF